MTVDKTKVTIERREVYFWAAIDVDTFENVHVNVPPCRSDVDVFVFLATVPKRCGITPSFSRITPVIQLTTQRPRFQV
jgi:transposase-like protein